MTENENKSLSSDVLATLYSKIKNNVSKRQGVIRCQTVLKDEDLTNLTDILDEANIVYEKRSSDNGTSMIVVTGFKDDQGNIKKNKINKKRTKKSNSPTHGHVENGVWYPSEEKWGKSGDKNCIVAHVEAAMQKKIPGYKFEGVPVDKDGNADFKDFSYGTIETDFYTEDRNINYMIADELMAKKRSDAGFPCTADDVKEWRINNKMTWHESTDCKSMMKVPSVLHGNVAHIGGVSTVKKNTNVAFGFEKKKRRKGRDNQDED